MDKEIVLFHLREALVELQGTIRDFEKETDYSETDLELGMGHLYHHLNTAWNGRNQTTEQHKGCAEQDFNRFRKFPKETEFSYLAVTEND